MLRRRSMRLLCLEVFTTRELLIIYTYIVLAHEMLADISFGLFILFVVSVMHFLSRSRRQWPSVPAVMFMDAREMILLSWPKCVAVCCSVLQ